MSCFVISFSLADMILFCLADILHNVIFISFSLADMTYHVVVISLNLVDITYHAIHS